MGLCDITLSSNGNLARVFVSDDLRDFFWFQCSDILANVLLCSTFAEISMALLPSKPV